jgi:hypothetical protein
MNVPDFSMTTLEAAMTNVLASVKIQVGQFNDQLKADYLTKFENWKANIGQPNASPTPPQPPNGLVLAYFTDPTNPKAQWAYPTTGATPVCEIPAYQLPVHVPNVGLGPDARTLGNGNWWNNVAPLANATIPDGVSGAGQVWMRLK